jgi:hypothetical protein
MPNLARTATRAPTSVIGRFKLLKLPKQVNEPLGDGLLKVVVCTEPSPDGGLKLFNDPSRARSSAGMTCCLTESSRLNGTIPD